MERVRNIPTNLPDPAASVITEPPPPRRPPPREPAVAIAKGAPAPAGVAAVGRGMEMATPAPVADGPGGRCVVEGVCCVRRRPVRGSTVRPLLRGVVPAGIATCIGMMTQKRPPGCPSGHGHYTPGIIQKIAKGLAGFSTNIDALGDAYEYPAPSLPDC
jgi:hypothetical protein